MTVDTLKDGLPITKEFLEKVLNRNILHFKVGEGSNPGDNFTSVLFSLEITVVGQQKPLHLLFKTFPHHPTRQKVLFDTNLFMKEYLVYEKFLPALINFQKELGIGRTLTLAVPTFVAGNAIDYTQAQDEVKLDVDPILSNFIIMMDERKTNGFKMANKMLSLGYHHVKLVFNELAKLHALGYAYKLRKGIPSVRSKFSFIEDPFFSNPTQKPCLESMVQMNFQLINDALQGFLSERPKILESLKKLESPGVCHELMGKFLDPNGMDENEVESLLKWKPDHYSGESLLQDQWIVPGHGDCWTNNMLFKSDDAGKITETVLVDLQLMRETCIMTDLTYFIYTSTDSEFREKYLEEMLIYYHGKFLEYCKILQVEPFQAFTVENFKRKFHRSKIFGFIFALIVQPIILMKPVDLETLDLANSDQDQDVENKDESFATMFQNFERDDDDKKLLRARFSAMLTELYEQGVL